MVPSLDLLTQKAKEYSGRDHQCRGRSVCRCSDRGAGEESPGAIKRKNQRRHQDGYPLSRNRWSGLQTDS